MQREAVEWWDHPAVMADSYFLNYACLAVKARGGHSSTYVGDTHVACVFAPPVGMKPGEFLKRLLAFRDGLGASVDPTALPDDHHVPGHNGLSAAILANRLVAEAAQRAHPGDTHMVADHATGTVLFYAKAVDPVSYGQLRRLFDDAKAIAKGAFYDRDKKGPRSMPLVKGSGKKAVSENISRLRKEGVPPKQAVARALKKARTNPKGAKG
jgi:hypothetical protein